MVTYRVASVDEPAAHALIVEYFAMRSETFPAALGTYRPTFPNASDFQPPAGVFLVVGDDGTDIGCGGVRAIAGASPGSVRFEIKHLYLRPDVQGRGLGRALLAELERRAIEFGATELVLDTNASLAAAGGLYRSSGYADIDPYNENPNATNWYLKRVG